MAFLQFREGGIALPSRRKRSTFNLYSAIVPFVSKWSLHLSAEQGTWLAFHAQALTTDECTLSIVKVA
ncbi:hypothetical protein [Glutamicibacter sp. NPDC087344]|uniref:hypothetical protein n=1 Tax=Glutamicibacter sp. NPDC087344 TaxID=3363994 RepID=UPI0037F60BE4